jgi:hypothetical protein
MFLICLLSHVILLQYNTLRAISVVAYLTHMQVVMGLNSG